MLPQLLSASTLDRIKEVALTSSIASYSWKDRGRAPKGYLIGFATAFAVCISRGNDPITGEMGRAEVGDEEEDALAWYADEFFALGMHNNVSGVDTLRHLWALMLGLGMRESSGKYCEGRDTSASNTTSETAEAGLFQMSWNAQYCSASMGELFDEYNGSPWTHGYESRFQEGVDCNYSSWECYGSGEGFWYQYHAKHLPVFACETTAIALRSLRQHWGPINRHEVELKTASDEMLKSIQAIVHG